MTHASGPDPRAAVAYWWQNANTGTRQKARDADYYSTAPLPPDLVATFSRAGVAIHDAHLVAPEGMRRGYYLSRETSNALRELDRTQGG